MSKYVSYQPVEGVYPHPNADRLSIVRIAGRQTVHPTSEAQLLRTGDLVVRFPVGICIDPERAKELGIANYCRPSRYNGKKSKCRVVSTKIRKVYSCGFIVPDCKVLEGELDEHFGVHKYEHPHENGDFGTDRDPQFPRYSEAKISCGEPSQSSANIRIGVVKVDGDWEYRVATERGVLREYSRQTQQKNIYWKLLDENLMGLLNHLCDGSKPVVIYGSRILDHVGGVLVVFDILVDGEFLPKDIIRPLCELYRVETFASVRPGA